MSKKLPDYVSVSLAAELSGVPERTLYGKIKDGTLPAIPFDRGEGKTGYLVLRADAANITNRGRGRPPAEVENNSRKSAK